VLPRNIVIELIVGEISAEGMLAETGSQQPLTGWFLVVVLDWVKFMNGCDSKLSHIVGQ
jgi:hypothetical protein